MSRSISNVGVADFNWDLYEDGWNGVSRKANGRIRKSKKSRAATDIVYSHEPYSQDLYNRISKQTVTNAKDAKKGDNLSISDISVIDENTVSVEVGHGANNIIVDLAKEGKLFEQFSINEKSLGKEEFLQHIQKTPEFKERLISMNLSVKLGTDTQKGSIWDSYVEKFVAELKEQITLESKAYYAKVLNTTPGGFNVEIANTIRAFMPGSMASSNKINDYESYVGRNIEVMIFSWTPKTGFVVSRKKFIEKVRPLKVQPYVETLKENPNHIYKGKITGCTQYGVFVELDEFITGMLHKSLVSDELRNKMRNNEIVINTPIDVYVDRVENNKVILSDVPTDARPEVEARRKAEDNAEKTEYMNNKNAARRKATALAKQNETVAPVATEQKNESSAEAHE